MSKANEVFRVDVVAASPEGVTLNIRVRTDDNWVYYENLHIAVGGNMIIRDECDTEYGPKANKIPRSDAIDGMVTNYG